MKTLMNVVKTGVAGMVGLAFGLCALADTVDTKVLVKLPAVRLKADAKLIACTIPEGGRMVFKDAAGKVGLVKKSDGVYVDRGIMVLIR